MNALPSNVVNRERQKLRGSFRDGSYPRKASMGSTIRASFGAVKYSRCKSLLTLFPLIAEGICELDLAQVFQQLKNLLVCCPLIAPQPPRCKTEVTKAVVAPEQHQAPRKAVIRLEGRSEMLVTCIVQRKISLNGHLWCLIFFLLRQVSKSQVSMCHLD